MQQHNNPINTLYVYDLLPSYNNAITVLLSAKFKKQVTMTKSKFLVIDKKNIGKILTDKQNNITSVNIFGKDTLTDYLTGLFLGYKFTYTDTITNKILDEISAISHNYEIHRTKFAMHITSTCFTLKITVTKQLISLELKSGDLLPEEETYINNLLKLVVELFEVIPQSSIQFNPRMSNNKFVDITYDLEFVPTMGIYVYSGVNTYLR